MDNKLTEKDKFKKLSIKDQILYTFLSRLADHYNKNSFWRESQLKLYSLKFAQIPDSFLKESLKNWLIEKMGPFIPTLPEIYEFVKQQRGFEKYWEYHYRGGDYCLDCRSDSEGKTGGYRNIFIWGYKDGIPKGRLHLAKCDCIPALTLKGPTYHELIAKMESVHPEAQITYSFYDGTRIVDSQSQSNFAWEERIVRGTVSRGSDGGYNIVWGHDFWRTSIGIRILECNNIEIPEEYRKAAVYQTEHYKSSRKVKARQDRRKIIYNDGYTGDTGFKSISNIKTSL